MPVSIDEFSKNSMGGTELMKFKLLEKISPTVLDKFLIICSRVREMDPSLIPIYWLHDLAEDPESEHLKAGGWNKFKKMIFVSNWQMQQYIKHFNMPWYKCMVIQNAIEPIPLIKKSSDKIKLIYHTTPHRGLNILIPVFSKLVEKYDNIELDVFSSFEIYGWKERDKQFEALFDVCRTHPKINYHGFQSNEVVRKALQEAHIYAYPSIWPETSCISLMEAMSAGCLCIHPNYAALFETASNFTWMYQFQEDPRDHMSLFYRMLDGAITQINDENIQTSLVYAKNYIDMIYNWDRIATEWTSLLTSLLPKEITK